MPLVTTSSWPSRPPHTQQRFNPRPADGWQVGPTILRMRTRQRFGAALFGRALKNTLGDARLLSEDHRRSGGATKSERRARGGGGER